MRMHMRHRLLALTVTAVSLTSSADLSAQGRGGAPQTPPVSAMETLGKIGIIVKDGLLMPVSEFADTTQWIRTRLWVETDFDSDGDGKKDRLLVDVTRPAAAEKAGLKLPVVMESSPYSGGT